MIRPGCLTLLFRAVATAALLSPLVVAAGCNNQQEMYALRDRLALTENRMERLQREKAEQRAELRKLREQVATLQDLGDVRLEKLYTVSAIRLGRHTGGVTLGDDRGVHDGVKVYLRPVDGRGDALKAAGSAVVELYDLAAPEAEKLIGRYEWSVEELSETWRSGFMAYHYGLECPWDQPPAHEDITVRVVFKEYLTGRTFTAQAVSKVRLPD